MNTEQSLVKTNRLIISEWITILSVLVGCFLFLLYRIEKQNERTDDLYERTNTLYEHCHEIAQKQNERTDRLYEMFIELLKETKKSG